ncbi:hypothetical protein TNCV_4174281 [Trichonephila clavipes]|nr:hypothetical protein TNCV_4174281 [Trichonephila clavipes]
MFHSSVTAKESHKNWTIFHIMGYNLISLLVAKSRNGIWNKSPNLEMGSGISHQLWKGDLELVAKSGNEK